MCYRSTHVITAHKQQIHSHSSTSTQADAAVCNAAARTAVPHSRSWASRTSRTATIKQHVRGRRHDTRWIVDWCHSRIIEVIPFVIDEILRVCGHCVAVTDAFAANVVLQRGSVK